MEPFDPTKPNIARVWDFWLGGKDNFAADRELARNMLAIHPVSAQMAQENRRFLGRAVSYVARHGVRQFVDVGANSTPRTATFIGGVARKPEQSLPGCPAQAEAGGQLGQVEQDQGQPEQ